MVHAPEQRSTHRSAGFAGSRLARLPVEPIDRSPTIVYTFHLSYAFQHSTLTKTSIHCGVCPPKTSPKVPTLPYKQPWS